MAATLHRGGGGQVCDGVTDGCGDGRGERGKGLKQQTARRTLAHDAFAERNARNCGRPEGKLGLGAGFVNGRFDQDFFETVFKSVGHVAFDPPVLDKAGNDPLRELVEDGPRARGWRFIGGRFRGRAGNWNVVIPIEFFPLEPLYHDPEEENLISFSFSHAMNETGHEPLGQVIYPRHDGWEWRKVVFN